MKSGTNVEKFEISNLTDIGKVYENNQDYYGRYQGVFGDLIIVCDGIGGYSGGEVASRMAVEVINDHFQRLPASFNPNLELSNALVKAHHSIAQYAGEHPEENELGTTAVILLLQNDRYWLAWIGDSRIYLKRSGKTTLLTKDHSWVQGLVDNGLIKPEQASTHPKKNIITRYLASEYKEAEVRGPFLVYKNDLFLLCSDGLSDYFTDSELNSYLEREPQIACKALVEEANFRGGKDNITLQIVKSNIGNAPPRIRTGFKLKLMLLLAGAVLVVTVAVLAILYYYGVIKAPFLDKLLESKPKAQTEQPKGADRAKNAAKN